MTTTTNTSDTTRLAPEHASTAHNSGAAALTSAASSVRQPMRRSRDSRRNRSESRRGKGTWKKLLWVRQSYPDNYTDEETFLDHLQRNPRLQPYEFWPLVADSTVIVQQVCTMMIFLCCFSGIYQERISPMTVVSLATIITVLGWVAWDAWVSQEQALSPHTHTEEEEFYDFDTPSASATATPKDASFKVAHSRNSSVQSTASYQTTVAELDLQTTASTIASGSSAHNTTGHPTGASSFASYSPFPPYGHPESRFSPRNQQRLATAKSAVLIYFALLGLSPILKSLTVSTAKDSIWAMSFWLMCINVFFFDYGGAVADGPGPTSTFPASLSTNAALMASTVLASRLPSTTHVFSLTLFSIEVFGLFPVFRRYLKHRSWRFHSFLTLGLVMGAGGGVGLSASAAGGWRAGLAGVVLGCLLTGLVMGLCSWWLIGLQRYKNEIHGPWDPARPIIRRRWD